MLKKLLFTLALFSTSAYSYTPNQIAECRMAGTWLSIVFMDKGDYQGKKVFEELSDRYFNYALKHFKKTQLNEYLDKFNTLQVSYQGLGFDRATNYAKSVMTECTKYQLN